MNTAEQKFQAPCNECLKEIQNYFCENQINARLNGL